MAPSGGSLIEALLNNRPYFGPELRALQGVPERHKYFRPIVEYVCRRFGGSIAILEKGPCAGASTVSWATALRDAHRTPTRPSVDPRRPYFELSPQSHSLYSDLTKPPATALLLAP